MSILLLYEHDCIKHSHYVVVWCSCNFCTLDFCNRQTFQRIISLKHKSRIDSSASQKHILIWHIVNGSHKLYYKQVKPCAVDDDDDDGGDEYTHTRAHAPCF